MYVRTNQYISYLPSINFLFLKINATHEYLLTIYMYDLQLLTCGAHATAMEHGNRAECSTRKKNFSVRFDAQLHKFPSCNIFNFHTRSFNFFSRLFPDDSVYGSIRKHY